ncbi:alanine racemase [Acetobacteraceae bacterium H6797]|nr:alanine racemase [Acetobacteraceae bacterium H6797]
MRIEELETPVPVVDLDIVERNLKKMQAYCDAHGLALRPHIKTHKMPEMAQRQIDLGAKGITCQKLGEAEVMVDAGILDIFISYPLIGAQKAARLAALAKRATMSVAVDNTLALATVAAAAKEAEAEIGVLVEFDSGLKRTGVETVEQALLLAKAITEQPYLRFAGLMTYPTNAQTALFTAEAKLAFEEMGIPIPMISGGGSPGAWTVHEVAPIDELRVGTYIYNDRAMVGAGAASLKECAMHVWATVISRPSPDRAILDAGSKTLSSDLVAPEMGPGYGLLVDYPRAVITRVNEEHGTVDLSACRRKPALGERVRILPNHTCVVTNLHDSLAFTRKGEVVQTIPVAARGKTS